MNIFILHLLLILFAGGKTAPADPTPVKVITYNLRLDVDSDSLDSWPHRQADFAAYIKT